LKKKYVEKARLSRVYKKKKKNKGGGGGGGEGLEGVLKKSHMKVWS